MKLLATTRFRKSIPEARRLEVFAAVHAALTAYGRPHLHAGMGLRRIPPYMECRCGLDLRLVFEPCGDALIFHLCGTHDEVREFLRNRR